MAGILVVVDHLDGVVPDIANEVIGAATALAKGHDTSAVSVLAIGSDPEQLKGQLRLADIDVAYLAITENNNFDADVYGSVLLEVAQTVRPSLILAGHTINGMTYSPIFATRIGCGFAADVFGIGVDQGSVQATRGAYGNKVESTLSFANKTVTLLTLRGGSYPANAVGEARQCVTIEVAPQPAPATRHVGYERPAQSDVDIAKADIILSVGRGIQDEANIPRFRELARRMGATFGCSRPIVDAGWLPKPHQVGQSGKIANSCKLYIALGISGAVQHLQGMKHVSTVIAVNTDAYAPIFNVAKYGVKMDLFEFADALEREFP